MCMAKISWDQKLPPDFLAEWRTLVRQFEEIDRIVIPRRYCSLLNGEVITDVQLHSFSDASQRNIATAIYLRFKLSSGKIKCVLISSKSRVLSKNKKFTIPRAELLGTLLMTEQSISVAEALSTTYVIKAKYYWIDSAVVYAWILNDAKRVDKYTNARLQKIKEVIKDVTELRLVPSKFNPADIGTRGMSPKELRNNGQLWFHGPEFLALSEEFWPNLAIGDKFENYKVETNAEANVDKTSNLGILVSETVKAKNVLNLIDAERYSSVQKLYRITGYVLRFVNKLLPVVRGSIHQRTRSR